MESSIKSMDKEFQTEVAEVDEDKERHGADLGQTGQAGTKQPYQLELTPSISAIRAR